MTTTQTALLVAVDGNLDQRPLDAELPENVQRLGTIDASGDLTVDEGAELTLQQRRSSGIVSNLGYDYHAYYLNGYLGKRHSEWFPLALDGAARKATDEEVAGIYTSAAGRLDGPKETILQDLGRHPVRNVLGWAAAHPELSSDELDQILRPAGREEQTTWLRTLWERRPR